MWCAHCRSDVAAEVSPDHRHVRCANCGGEISASLTARTQTRTRQARELLERWSRERTGSPAEVAAESSDSPAILSWEPKPNIAESAAEKVDTFQPPAAMVEEAKPSQPIEPKSEPAKESARKFRIDAGHQTEELMRPKIAEPVEETPTPAAQTAATSPATIPAKPQPAEESDSTHYRVDAAHAVPRPHFTVTAPKTEPEKPAAKSKWVATVGQALAYTGVLGLMAGTCLVILGYFRGPASYAPTGWLITMASQMLLFLGVITLVSSGMEETTNTVAERIDKLNEKLLRIEQATETLRGPHFMRRDAGQNQPTESDVRRAS